MQLSVSGQHLEITPALRDHVADKVDKIARRFEGAATTHVVLSIEKTRHTADATVTAKGATWHASGVADDMYAAIDSMAGKLDRQVMKHKEKRADHHRLEASKSSAASSEAS